MQNNDTFKESFVLIDNKKIIRVNIPIENISIILNDLLEKQREKGFLLEEIHILDRFVVENCIPIEYFHSLKFPTLQLEYTKGEFLKLLLVFKKSSKKDLLSIHYVVKEYKIHEKRLINFFLEDSSFISKIMGSYTYSNTKVYIIISISIKHQRKIEDEKKE